MKKKWKSTRVKDRTDARGSLEKAGSELKAAASPAIPAAEEPFWTGVSRPVGITPKPTLEAPTTTGPDVK